MKRSTVSLPRSALGALLDLLAHVIPYTLSGTLCTFTERPRSVLGALLDPLGIFRNSVLVQNDDRDQARSCC